MKEGDAEAFREACKTHSYDARKHILPHGSYLINLAQPDEAKATQAYDCFLDDLKRCERLGIGLYNFHPGSTLGKPRQEALGRIAKALNKSHKETEFCKTVIENMAGHGNIIGGDFEDLRDIIKDVEDKSRIGVCLDTCHLFAAGHDIRTKEAYNAVLASFDQIVGLRYLSALHLNDSKAPLGSRRDLHQNIGLGYLGVEPFRLIVNDHRLAGLPMILETPNEENPQVWADEIKLLESFIGRAGDEEDFLETARILQASGAPERQKVGAVVERKAKEKADKEKKGTVKRGRKKRKESEEDESEGCSH
jgi:AP endonuclease-1